MDCAEVVVHEVKRHGEGMHFNLLAEAIGQTREAPHLHPHGEILTLNEAGRDVPFVWRAGDRCTRGAKKPSGRIPRPLIVVSGRSVSLRQYREINIGSERVINTLQIHAVAVRRQLHAVGKTRSNVVHEIVGACLRALSDEPRHHQLRIGVNRGPRPAVAPLTLFVFRDVLRFCADERPNFIALNPLRFQVPNVRIVIGQACGTEIAKQLFYRHPRHASQARRSAKAVAFNQRGNYGGAAFGGQPIHNGHYACSAKQCQGEKSH